MCNVCCQKRQKRQDDDIETSMCRVHDHRVEISPSLSLSFFSPSLSLSVSLEIVEKCKGLGCPIAQHFAQHFAQIMGSMSVKK